MNPTVYRHVYGRCSSLTYLFTTSSLSYDLVRSSTVIALGSLMSYPGAQVEKSLCTDSSWGFYDLTPHQTV